MRSSKKTRSKADRPFNPDAGERRHSAAYPEILREYASTGFRDDPRSERTAAAGEPDARKR